MQYNELLDTGQLDGALAALQSQAKQSPDKADLWVHLFALNCVMGKLDKALACLQKAASLDEGWVLPAQENRLLIGCELIRREVFVGKRKPLILGEPPEWIAGFVEALTLDPQGKTEEAGRLRATAWEQAPALPSKVNGEACEWLSDADHRLGPILETCLDGRYYWIPFNQIKTIECQPAQALIELVWLPASVRLAGGALLRAYLPVRYPGSETAPDAELRLARRTEWEKAPGGGDRGLGQRLLAHPKGDYALLECRNIEFS
jgi:type VI secretion system protein ImpE